MDTKNTTLEDIGAVVGFTATMKLSAWFGDAGNCYVPQKMEEGNLIAKLIGLGPAKRLSDEFPGEYLAIPRLRDYEDALRKKSVARMFEHNMPSKEIALLERISEKRVLQILRELEIAGLIEIIGPKNTREKSQGKIPLKNAGEKAMHALLLAIAEDEGIEGEFDEPQPFHSVPETEVARALMLMVPDIAKRLVEDVDGLVTGEQIQSGYDSEVDEINAHRRPSYVRQSK